MSKKIQIEIDEDVFNFIRSLATLLATQNNRGTQDVAFVITDEYRIPCNHYDDYDGFERDFEAEMCESCSEKHDENKLDEDVFCEECGHDCFDYYKSEDRQTEKTGFFLTEKACLDHIAQNKHHYSDKVSTYGIHLWRNYEMQMLINSVFKISGIDQPSHYSKTF